jgi:hypothetical protein
MLRESEVTLAFLSKTSIDKRGYVQREFRLALDVAMERPSASPSLVPVLLEYCEPPDVRVDTISLAQLQWYRLYEIGLGRLIAYLLQLTEAEPTERAASDSPVQLHDILQEIELLRSSMAARDVEVSDLKTAVARLQKQGAASGDLAQSEDEVAGVLDVHLTDIRKGRFVNPFQTRISEWRVRRTSRTLAAIANRDWNIDTLSPSEYLVYTLASIVEMLRPEEDYFAITNSRFWADPSISRSVFIRDIVDAAVLGVDVRHVILISESDLDDPAYAETLRLTLLKQLAGVREATAGSGRMLVRVMVRTDLTGAIAHYGQFALARAPKMGVLSDSDGLIVLPRYENWKRTDSISAVRLLFSNGPLRGDPNTRDYLERFEAAESDSIELEAFLSTWPDA